MQPINQSLYNPLESAGIYCRSVLYNIGLQLIVGIILSFVGIMLDREFDIENIYLNLILMFALQGAMFYAVYSKSLHKKQALTAQIKQKTKPNQKIILLGILLGIITFIGFMSSNMYFSLLLEYMQYDFNSIAFDGVFSIILGFIAICIVAPIIEELVFRFGVLDGLKQDGKKRSIIFCAAAFALMHMSPEQTFYQFALGLVSGIFVLATGSLLVGIIIHMTNNIISFSLAFIPIVDSGLGFYFTQWYSIIISIILASAAIGTLYFLYKKIKLSNNTTTTNIDNIEVHSLQPTPPQDIFANQNQFPTDNVFTNHTAPTQTTFLDNNNVPTQKGVPNNDTIRQMQQKANKTTKLILLTMPLLLCTVMWIIQLVSGL